MGVEKGKLIHSKITTFITRDSWDAYYFHTTEVLKNNSGQSEIQLLRKDGTVFDAQLESLAVHFNGKQMYIRTSLSYSHVEYLNSPDRKKYNQRRIILI